MRSIQEAMGGGGGVSARWRPPDLVGTVLDGRYEIRRVLGAGGMGAVYEAQQRTLQKPVAIKVLHPRLSGDSKVVKRFLREARAASLVRNMHVVDITDFGEGPGGLVYCVMELLPGRDLAHHIRARGRIDWPRARSILLQMVHALAAAHARGVIHRDIKPANCILLPNPDDPSLDFVKVVDFGIAKTMEPDAETDGITTPGDIMGTAAYMAPEQALARPVDARTDVYALGIVAYEMLSGRVPFEASNVFEVLRRHCHEPPAPLQTLDPTMPAAIDNLVLKALQKRPEDRFQSMLELERALLAIDDAGHYRTDGQVSQGLEQTLLPAHAPVDAQPSAPWPAKAMTPPPPRRVEQSTLRRHRSRKWSTAMVAFIIGWMLVMAGGVVLGAWLVARHVGTGS